MWGSMAPSMRCKHHAGLAKRYRAWQYANRSLRLLSSQNLQFWRQSIVYIAHAKVSCIYLHVTRVSARCDATIHIVAAAGDHGRFLRAQEVDQ
jgi:hypothetical protein